jgi:hypothetical protein
MRMSIAPRRRRDRARARRRRAIAGLADDRDVGFTGEDHTEAGANEFLVVGDEDANAHATVASWEARADDETAARSGAALQDAADDRDALAHADESVPRAVAPLPLERPSSEISSSSSSGP